MYLTHTEKKIMHTQHLGTYKPFKVLHLHGICTKLLTQSCTHTHTHTHTHKHSLRGYARSFEWTGSHDDQTVRDR